MPTELPTRPIVIPTPRPTIPPTTPPSPSAVVVVERKGEGDFIKDLYANCVRLDNPTGLVFQWRW
jgi:hypothetical protein